MATHPSRKRWTYEEFAQLPEDGNRYEIIAGELYVSPAPRPKHQKVLTALLYELMTFVRAHELGELYVGPIDVLFAIGDYMEPDLVFIRRDRTDIISERGIEAAPDLIVEVLSPSTAARDRGIKRERYAMFGVPEYWVVDVDRAQIVVHRLADDAANAAMVAVDTLTWQPIGGGPVLALSVPALLRAD